MGRLTDAQLRAWVRAANPIAGKSDGDGLTFTFSAAGVAAWVLRYRHGGKRREVSMGRYPDIGLAEARTRASELRAKVQGGDDVATLKQAEKVKAATASANTVEALAYAWLERVIAPRVENPGRVRRQLERYVLPVIGSLSAEDVTPMHVDQVLRSTVEAGAPTVANDVMRHMKRLFAYGRKRHMLSSNPAADFDSSDAGGSEKPRDRALSLEEVGTLFAAMEATETLGRDNELAIKLLLLLGVRKMELLAAQWSEFDLDAGTWALPAERRSGRAKTKTPITIPLPPLAVSWLEELEVRAGRSEYVFPARRLGTRRLGHISPDTVNLSLQRVEHGLEPFTLHDLRRTVRTQLAALGVPFHVAERVLNHKLKGIEAVYNRYDYIEERREALDQWARVLDSLESGNQVVPIMRIA